ncbi:MAG: hypothetical protein IPK19_02880 [Chloroflexi bacterium]|nr:hypothetical protein [Chloroflexota bacterium]
MDLSGGLYTLPSEALTILRFFATAESEAAHVDAIIDGTGLTDRGFGKGIRRLVTRNYLTLSGEQVYRLTEQGRRAVRALSETGGLDDMPEDDELLPAEDEPRFVRRRMILVTPAVLTAESSTTVILGFDTPDDEDRLELPPNLLVRMGVVNGEPQRNQDITLELSNEPTQHSFNVVPGAFTRVRLRAEVFQLKDANDDFEFCGGMYVDLPVERNPEPESSGPTAHGVDVILREPVAS